MIFLSLTWSFRTSNGALTATVSQGLPIPGCGPVPGPGLFGTGPCKRRASTGSSICTHTDTCAHLLGSSIWAHTDTCAHVYRSICTRGRHLDLCTELHLCEQQVPIPAACVNEPAHTSAFPASLQNWKDWRPVL